MGPLATEQLDRSPRASRFPWQALAAGGLIVLAGAASYHNSLRGPFVLDDLASIPENPTIRHLWPIGPVLYSARSATVVGRPILNLSLAVNYAIGGADVGGYHVFNLVVHVLAGLALLGVVRRTLLLPSMPQATCRTATALAAAIALLWTVHPLQTASVTYIVQRAESMMGLFYLLTLYCVIRGASAPRPIGWHVAGVTACLLGMATKETMASAPLVALLLDRVFISGSFREALRRRWGLYVGLAATWVLLAALVLTSGGREQTAGFGYGMTSWEYARTQFGFLVRYLGLAFWPEPLVFDYGSAVAQTAGEIVPYAAIVVALLAGTLLAFRRWPRAGFLGAGFFLILAPTSSVVPLATQVGAEHRMYLPLAAVATLVVMLACAGWNRAVPLIVRSDGARRWLGRAVPAAALVAVAATFGYLTYVRNMDYRTPMSIWEDTIRKYPRNARAHSNVGALLATSGNLGRAVLELNEAIQLKPDYASAYSNRGNAWHQLGRYEQSIADCTQAISLQPDHAPAYNNRGNSYQAVGRYDLALADYTRAISIQPTYAAAYSNRGNTYHHLGQYGKAYADCTRAIELDPASADPYNNRANASLALGRYDDALRDYNQAITLAPRFGQAYRNRAVAYYFQKQYDRAWADITTARKFGAESKPEFVRMLIQASGRSDQPRRSP